MDLLKLIHQPVEGLSFMTRREQNLMRANV